MKLSNREKFLIDMAYEAGFSGPYEDSEAWLASPYRDTGDDMEEQLAQTAAEIKED